MPDQTEALDVTKIYSVADLLLADTPFIHLRQFRAPHHTINRGLGRRRALTNLIVCAKPSMGTTVSPYVIAVVGQGLTRSNGQCTLTVIEH